MNKDKKRRVSTAFRVDPEVLKILEKTASERDIYLSRALDAIVLEWAEKDKRKRLKDAQEAITLNKIEVRLKGIEIKLDSINSTVEDTNWEMNH